MEFIEINWLLKYTENFRSSHGSISINSCTELNKTQFFPVNIVNFPFAKFMAQSHAKHFFRSTSECYVSVDLSTVSKKKNYFNKVMFQLFENHLWDNTIFPFLSFSKPKILRQNFISFFWSSYSFWDEAMFHFLLLKFVK